MVIHPCPLADAPPRIWPSSTPCRPLPLSNTCMQLSFVKLTGNHDVLEVQSGEGRRKGPVALTERVLAVGVRVIAVGVTQSLLLSLGSSPHACYVNAC